MNNYKINIVDGILYAINNLYNKNKISDNTILIIPILDNGLEEILKIRNEIKNKIILILYEKYINKITDYSNIEIITIPNNMPNSEINFMASDIKEEYLDSYIFDLSNEKELETYFSKIISKDIVSKYNNIDKIYIPFIYKSLYQGLYKYFKLVYDDIKIILINNNSYDISDIEYDELLNDLIDDESSSSIFISI